jgi:inner membrane protein involved in colicin E2 resistance
MNEDFWITIDILRGNIVLWMVGLFCIAFGFFNNRELFLVVGGVMMVVSTLAALMLLVRPVDIL